MMLGEDSEQSGAAQSRQAKVSGSVARLVKRQRQDFVFQNGAEEAHSI